MYEMTSLQAPPQEITTSSPEQICLSDEVLQVRERLGLDPGVEHIFQVEHHTPGWESFSLTQYEESTALVLYSKLQPLGVSLEGLEYTLRRSHIFMFREDEFAQILTADVFSHGSKINIGRNETITDFSEEMDPEDVAALESLQECFRRMLQCVRREDLISAHPALQIPNQQL